MNCLEKLLQLYSDRDWDFEKLSKNPNMTIRIVMKNLDKPFNWKELTRNSGIKICDIESTPALKWDKESIFENPNMTREQLLKHSKDDELIISKSYDEDDEYIGYGWTFGYCSAMNHLFDTMTEKEVIYSLNKYNKYDIQYRKNMSFKLLEFIMCFYGIPSYWYWYLYSMSSGVTMDDVKETEETFQFLREDRLAGKDMKSDEIFGDDGYEISVCFTPEEER